MQESNDYMKNIKILLVSQLILLCLVGWIGFTLAVLTGCSSKAEPDSSMTVDDTDGLVVLCLHKLSDSKTNITFIRDTYTDNIYIKCFEEDFYAGGGSFSPYYNAEGKIMKYDEFTQVHKH